MREEIIRNVEELEEEWKEVFDSMQNKFGFGGFLED